MKYISKLKVPLEIEKNKVTKIEEELHMIFRTKKRVENQIQKEEDKIYDLHARFKGTEVVSSSFFNSTYDRIYILQKTVELNEVKLLIRTKTLELQKQKDRLKKMIEVDQNRKKAFESLVEKKEQIEYEELKSIVKVREERGE